MKNNIDVNTNYGHPNIIAGYYYSIVIINDHSTANPTAGNLSS
jgi:hypothetical protein